jgi:hypothetical protein
MFNEFLKKLKLKLSYGSHSCPEKGLCVMECVAHIMGLNHTDMPDCSSPLVAHLAVRVNDSAIHEDRQRLLSYVLRLAGSRTQDVKIITQRLYTVMNHVFKVAFPYTLRNIPGNVSLAVAFESLPDIVDDDTLEFVIQQAASLNQRCYQEIVLDTKKPAISGMNSYISNMRDFLVTCRYNMPDLVADDNHTATASFVVAATAVTPLMGVMKPEQYSVIWGMNLNLLDKLLSFTDPIPEEPAVVALTKIKQEFQPEPV